MNKKTRAPLLQVCERNKRARAIGTCFTGTPGPGTHRVPHAVSTSLDYYRNIGVAILLT